MTKKPGAPLDSLRFYLSFFRPQLPQIFIILGLFIVKHGAWMAFPLIVKHIIDVSIPKGMRTGEVAGIFLAIPLVMLMGLINLAAHSPYMMLVAQVVKTASRDVRDRLVTKLQILSLSYLNRSESGRHYSKIMVDVTKAETFAQMVFQGFTGAILTFVYASIFLALANWRLLGIYCLTLPVYLGLYWLWRKRFRSLQHQARMADEDLSASVNGFIQTSILSRVHGEEEYEKERVYSKGRNVIDRYKHISRSIGTFTILNGATSQIFQILVITLSAVAVIRGQMTLGELVLFYQYISQMINALNMVMDMFPQYTAFQESIVSIHELLQSPDVECNQGKKDIGKLRGEIEFRGATFAYEAGRPALRDLSVRIQPGTSVALVGPSGSGKSTFINLVLGLLRPQSGQVLLDGIDMEEIDMRTVRRQVGVVTQDPILFRGTIAENIAHARQNEPRSEIEKAARLANADGFLRVIPGGYEAGVGERGATLSGGQKQRIAIARAILRRPGILILDEATSALDSLSEREVQKGIESVLGMQTTLTIAHRLSTIMRSDLILVFRDGEIIEHGNHQVLMQQGGLYAELLQMQNASGFLLFDHKSGDPL